MSFIGLAFFQPPFRVKIERTGNSKVEQQNYLFWKKAGLRGEIDINFNRCLIIFKKKND